MLAIGSDDNSPANAGLPKVVIYETKGAMDAWVKKDELTTLTEPVHDLAFAPSVGRSFNLLAVASANALNIITLKVVDENNRSIAQVNDSTNNRSKFSPYEVGAFLFVL